MREKIKNFFGFIGRAWTASWRGKVGILMLAFALFMFVRIFWGTVNVQKFIMNIWRLNTEETQLMAEQEKLSLARELLRNYFDACDYFEYENYQEIKKLITVMGKFPRGYEFQNEKFDK